MTVLSLTFLASALTAAVYSNAQVNDKASRQEVLQKAIVDSLFVFGKWTEKGGTETHLKYLGQVTTKHGQTFKILNSSWFWGLSHRATSRILVFNEKNKYVGNYPSTLTTDLPTKMENGKLVFENTDESCDKNLVTIVDFKNGLPRHFFKKCNDQYGDTYSFNTE